MNLHLLLSENKNEPSMDSLADVASSMVKMADPQVDPLPSIQQLFRKRPLDDYQFDSFGRKRPWSSRVASSSLLATRKKCQNDDESPCCQIRAYMKEKFIGNEEQLSSKKIKRYCITIS